MVRFHAFSFIFTGSQEPTPTQKQTSMKRIFTFFFALLSACTFSAYAAIVEGTCGDNLTWTLNTKDSTLVISGTGAMTDNPSWSDYRSYIKYVTLPDGLTSIGDYAFYSCESLTSVTIPNSVTSIGVLAFSSCSALTSITIPNSVTSTGDYAFSNCYSLTSVTLDSGVTSIGDYAFSNCSALTSITIPNSVTSIGNSAFIGCSALTSITIPNSVTSIGNSAFFYCSSLTSITIPNSVTSIGESAFRGCTSLTSVTIGNSVTSIGNSAFYECSNIQEVTAYMPTPIDAKDCGINPAAATLYVPAEYIDTYSNTLWWEDFKEIRAITITAAPEVFVNPANPTQKLLRNGQVYILQDGKTYTITGQEL